MGTKSGKSLSLLRDQLTIQGINHLEHETFFRANKQDEVSFVASGVNGHLIQCINKAKFSMSFGFNQPW